MERISLKNWTKLEEMSLLFFFFLRFEVVRYDGHLDEQGLQETPADSQLIDLFQVPDGVPAVVAGSDDQLGAGGDNLIPLHL
jgi:hypothetical protein